MKTDLFGEEIPEDEVVEEEAKITKIPIFDFLNDVYHKKEHMDFDELCEKSYSPWSMNKFISGNMDTVLYAQEMNQRHSLSKEAQYEYYFNIIRKRKRYSKWLKSKRTKDLELIMQYYGYNIGKANQVLSLHTDDELEEIKRRLY
jgi:hypothetical protein